MSQIRTINITVIKTIGTSDCGKYCMCPHLNNILRPPYCDIFDKELQRDIPEIPGLNGKAMRCGECLTTIQYKQKGSTTDI